MTDECCGLPVRHAVWKVGNGSIVLTPDPKGVFGIVDGIAVEWRNNGTRYSSHWCAQKPKASAEK